MRISRTTLSCSLRAKGYVAYHAGDAFTARCHWASYSLESPSRSYNQRLLHFFQPSPRRTRHHDGSAFALAYVLLLRSCRLMGALYHVAPASHSGEGVMNSWAPWLHGRYSASSLLRAQPPPVSSSADFPVDTGYTAYLAPPISRRDEDASPVAWHILVTVLPLPPRRSESTRRSGFVDPYCLRWI